MAWETALAGRLCAKPAHGTQARMAGKHQWDITRPMSSLGWYTTRLQDTCWSKLSYPVGSSQQSMADASGHEALMALWMESGLCDLAAKPAALRVMNTCCKTHL